MIEEISREVMHALSLYAENNGGSIQYPLLESEQEELQRTIIDAVAQGIVEAKELNHD